MEPQLLHLAAHDGEFHVKAGGLSEPRSYFACKVNGGFFGNRTRSGLPNIIGLILLCDGTTGMPLALMESGVVTRLRTAAATAVAAKYLARADSRIATICGAGMQAEAQLRALSAVLPLERVLIWSRGDAGSLVESGRGPFDDAPAKGATFARASALAQRMSQELSITVLATGNLREATRQSDVIVTCTPARQWFLGVEHVAAGTFIAAVGADSPEKQELQPELLATTSVVCDLVDQCAQVGDLHHAITARLMSAREIRGELGDVIVGKVPRRASNRETIVFDSTGTALQDVAAASSVYERAVQQGSGRPFAFWT